MTKERIHLEDSLASWKELTEYLLNQLVETNFNKFQFQNGSYENDPKDALNFEKLLILHYLFLYEHLKSLPYLIEGEDFFGIAMKAREMMEIYTQMFFLALDDSFGRMEKAKHFKVHAELVQHLAKDNKLGDLSEESHEKYRPYFSPKKKQYNTKN
jgi:hypothetical protein